MKKTSPEVRKRINLLGLRIAELQTSGAKGHPALAAALADLQAEQAVWKLLLVTRRLQLHDSVINLARWRDGFAATQPTIATRPAHVPVDPSIVRIGRARKEKPSRSA